MAKISPMYLTLNFKQLMYKREPCRDLRLDEVSFFKCHISLSVLSKYFQPKYFSDKAVSSIYRIKVITCSALHLEMCKE